jgi:hypothetical protein
MAYHPFKWSKTDASPDRWPPTGRTGARDASWYENVPTSGTKYELYETKVGQHVAQQLALGGTGTFLLILPFYCRPGCIVKGRELI